MTPSLQSVESKYKVHMKTMMPVFDLAVTDALANKGTIAT